MKGVGGGGFHPEGSKGDMEEFLLFRKILFEFGILESSVLQENLL